MPLLSSLKRYTHPLFFVHQTYIKGRKDSKSTCLFFLMSLVFVWKVVYINLLSNYFLLNVLGLHEYSTNNERNLVKKIILFGDFFNFKVLRHTLLSHRSF